VSKDAVFNTLDPGLRECFAPKRDGPSGTIIRPEVRKPMPPKLDQVDSDLVEAIARRVAELIVATPSTEPSRRQLRGVRPDGLADPEDEMLTPDEAAPIMRHAAKSVRKFCALPKDDPRYLKHLRKGSMILIRRFDIADWIARQIGDD